jgi:hydroxyethylthiazole kinase-like uncharacterized protein yjeF
MEYLVNSSEMQRYDAYTINNIGIPSLVLMERAALAAVDTLFFAKFNLQKTAVVCGIGNNGGDGIAIARLLKVQHIDVTVYMAADRAKATESTQRQLAIAEKLGVNIVPLTGELSGYTTVIDALFGIGLSRPIVGQYAAAVELINRSGAEVMAIDIASGVSADSGQILGTAVKAKHTVAFGFKKRGHLLYPGSDYSGVLTVKDIGINRAAFAEDPPSAYAFTPQDLSRLMPPRANHSNKGSFGKVLTIAGSETMSGAAYFSAKAAYKTGAGLVKIYTPEVNRSILLGQLPEAIISAYDPTHWDPVSLDAAMAWASVIVIGPGIGTETAAVQIVRHVLNKANVPLIIDADALNILSNEMETVKKPSCPIIVTPHLGEMARLTSSSIEQIRNDLVDSAVCFAQRHRLICILKDARTVIAKESGPVYINQSGNHGMATGGSGDVLTGIIAGLIAQGCDAATAADLGVYLHGVAGDRAKQRANEYSMTASDLIFALDDVLKLQDIG